MKEYIVKVKDLDQDTTHTLTEKATSKNMANVQALTWLGKHIGQHKYEIKSCKERYKKYRYGAKS